MPFNHKCHPYLLSSIPKPLMCRQYLEIWMVIDEASESLMVNFPCSLNPSLLQTVLTCLYIAGLERMVLHLHDWKTSVHLQTVSSLLSWSSWSSPTKWHPVSSPHPQPCNTCSRFLSSLFLLSLATISTDGPHWLLRHAPLMCSVMPATSYAVLYLGHSWVTVLCPRSSGFKQATSTQLTFWKLCATGGRESLAAPTLLRTTWFPPPLIQLWQAVVCWIDSTH